MPPILAVAAQQPPPDNSFMQVAGRAHLRVTQAVRTLSAMPEQDEERLYVWTWQLALGVLSAEIGEAALSLCHSGPLRAARTLNRSLFEYAIRAHYYARAPAAAVTDAKSTPNLLNRVIQAQAKHGKAEPAVNFFRQLIPVGTAAKQPRTREMIKALVLNMTRDAARSNVVIDQLDDEYALSTAFAHGSQAMFVDVFHGPTNEIFPRTRSLTRLDELLRAITCLIAFLSALETTYGNDFGRGDLVAAVCALGPFDAMTTIARRNALRNLLGIG